MFNVCIGWGEFEFEEDFFELVEVLFGLIVVIV